MLLLLPRPEHGSRLAISILLWVLPALGASLRYLRGERGARLGWLVVAAAIWLVVADKAWDLQTLLYRGAQEMVHRVDPQLRMRGPHAWMRWCLLGGGFLLSAALLWWGARADRQLTGGKRLSLLGLVAILAYLGARLLPRVKAHLDGGAEDWIELAIWVVIAVGIALGESAKSEGEDGRGAALSDGDRSG